MLCTVWIGVYSREPALARLTVPDSGALCSQQALARYEVTESVLLIGLVLVLMHWAHLLRAHTTMPSARKNAAVRMMAPRFCGSTTWSSASHSGGCVPARRNVCDTCCGSTDV